MIRVGGNIEGNISLGEIYIVLGMIFFQSVTQAYSEKDLPITSSLLLSGIVSAPLSPVAIKAATSFLEGN